MACYGLRSQEFQATYSYTYTPDSTNLDVKRTVLTVLNINDVGSVFATEGNLKRDSLYLLLRENKTSRYDAMEKMRELNKVARFPFIISKNYDSKEIMHHDVIATSNFKYLDNPNLDWQISEEIKFFLNYQCQRAEVSFAGRKYIAWFTNEIPISDGPYLFQGLPGLIIAIEDTKKQHVFELSSFTSFVMSQNQQRYQDGLYKNDRYNETTKENFQIAKKNYFENPEAFMEAQGVVVLSKDAPKINPWRGVIKNSIILKEY